MICAANDNAQAPIGGGRMSALRRGSMLCVRAAVLGMAMAAAGNGVTNGALAGEFDGSFLRGSLANQGIKGYGNWNGIYVGGLIGAGTMNANFGNGAGSLIAFILRNTVLENEARVSNWTTLPQGSGNGRTWGGFAGYNYQFDKLVLGAEATYTRTLSSFAASASDVLNRSYQTSDGYLYGVNLAAQGTVTLKDYGTFRARAGYTMGQFLPYAALGLAVARVDYATGVTLSSTGVDITGGGRPNVVLPATSLSDIKSNAFAYGGVLAVGVDVTLLPNLFLRGEWEYMAFAPISGIRMSVNTVRAGLGLKF